MLFRSKELEKYGEDLMYRKLLQTLEMLTKINAQNNLDEEVKQAKLNINLVDLVKNRC